MAFDITKHALVPKHSKLSDTEKAKLVAAYGVTGKDLPKIKNSDPSVAKLGVKPGDVIKIERESKTAGQSAYYRVIIDG